MQSIVDSKEEPITLADKIKRDGISVHDHSNAVRSLQISSYIQLVLLLAVLFFGLYLDDIGVVGLISYVLWITVFAVLFFSFQVRAYRLYKLEDVSILEFLKSKDVCLFEAYDKISRRGFNKFAGIKIKRKVKNQKAANDSK